AINVISGSHTIATPGIVNKNTGMMVLQWGDTLTMAGGLSGGSGVGISKSGDGTLQVSNIRVGALSINAGKVQLMIDGSAGGASKLNALTIASGAALDLTNNQLIVSGANRGSWNGAHYDGVTGLIEAGRNGGTWNGRGIVTSQSDAASPNALTTLAVAAAGDVGKSTFGGISVAATDVLVMYTYAGDADLSGAINGDDYVRIDSGYAAHASGYASGDFNYDGRVDADDYFIIDSNFAAQGTAFASGAMLDAAGGAQAVP